MNAIPLTVTRVGFRATFTDLGRRNAEISGVPTGGAADQHSAVVANILAGNARDGVLIDADVASMYPTIILMLGLFPQALGEHFLATYRGIPIVDLVERQDAGPGHSPFDAG